MSSSLFFRDSLGKQLLLCVCQSLTNHFLGFPKGKTLEKIPRTRNRTPVQPAAWSNFPRAFCKKVSPRTIYKLAKKLHQCLTKPVLLCTKGFEWNLKVNSVCCQIVYPWNTNDSELLSRSVKRDWYFFRMSRFSPNHPKGHRVLNANDRWRWTRHSWHFGWRLRLIKNQPFGFFRFYFWIESRPLTFSLSWPKGEHQSVTQLVGFIVGPVFWSVCLVMAPVTASWYVSLLFRW